jgi:acyl carrier protein
MADSVNIENEIVEIIKTIRKHQGIRDDEFGLDSPLYDSGIGLDSLCVAELSAMLEKTYGKDPYTSGVMPQTVGDILEFYS